MNTSKDKIYETNFEFCNDDQPACFSSTDPVWIKRIQKLAKAHPDEVRIVEYKEKESICVNVPKEWFKVQPKRAARNMTEEQKAAAAERMRKAREKKLAEKEVEKLDNEGWL